MSRPGAIPACGRRVSISRPCRRACAIPRARRHRAPGIAPPVLTEGVDDLACHCTPDTFEVGTIWGTHIYTSDSQICRSALHAGGVGPAGSGVHVMRLGGQQSCEASTRNGVNSFSYDSWGTSIGFE